MGVRGDMHSPQGSGESGSRGWSGAQPLAAPQPICAIFAMDWYYALVSCNAQSPTRTIDRISMVPSLVCGMERTVRMASFISLAWIT